MDNNLWIQKWKINDIGFHQKEFNPHLLKNFSNLPPCSFFVPLCGKSSDLIWLKEQGHKVQGVELSELACQAFFEENKIKYTVKEQESFKVFSSEKITLWCGDIFELKATSLGKIDRIFDRAALIALPQELRRKYSKIISDFISFQNNPVQMMVITINYPQDQIAGPPFSVPPEEIETLYGKNFEIKTLAHKLHEKMSANNPRFANLETFENVFLIQRNN